MMATGVLKLVLVEKFCATGMPGSTVTVVVTTRDPVAFVAVSV